MAVCTHRFAESPLRYAYTCVDCGLRIDALDLAQPEYRDAVTGKMVSTRTFVETQVTNG